MAIEGFYYLHTNGDLIYKRNLGDTAADLRETPFSRAVWAVDPTDRANAWGILVEALAAGANAARVAELAANWGCTDEDAKVYAEHVGARLERDGTKWAATRSDFVNLQESPAGFGDTALEALAELAKELGYRPAKMWGATFVDLLAKAA